jgi:cytochrome c peroxidase
MPSLHAFMVMTVTERLGGTGLDPTSESELIAFMENAPPPDNPLKGLPLNASQQRGAQLFVSSGCSACHAGSLYTNNGFANVGTLSTNPSNPDEQSLLLNVPSLLGVGRTAPYLHDGSQATLGDRLMMNQSANLHGQTSGLSSQDIDDLVAYLQKL